MSRLEGSRSRLACPVALLFLSLVVVGSCDDGTPAEPQATEGALFGTISISGHVLDANGLGRANVTVTLAGSGQGTRTTDAQGAYAFTGLAAGSYSVRPTFSGCTFNPDVVNLNNLSASTVRDFFGSGTSCGGTGNVNAGAMSGPLTISGTVTDAAGNRVVGGKITLGGGATAIRFTDHTGKYAFHVPSGFYSLTASGACGLFPASTSFQINGNRTQNFTGGGAGCLTAHPASTSPTGQYLTVSQGTAPVGDTIVRVEPRASAADALAALQAISQETSVAVRWLTIAGNPALERQVAVPTPELELPGAPELENTIGLTTAIAAGATLVRFESRLPDDASSATINAIFLAGRNFQPENLSAFVIPPWPTVPTSRPATPPGPPPEVQFAPYEIGLMGAEGQVAASETSNSFVVAGAGLVSYSTDNGVTVPRSTVTKVAPTGAMTFVSRSDPQVAVGPWNGTTSPYYHTELAEVTAPAAGKLPVLAIGLWKSVDDGQTFTPAPVAFPVNCGTLGTCVASDQAQLAVDTHNRTAGGDQIYLAWRNAVSFSNALTLVLACSTDGGQTWKFENAALATKNEDYPRLSVANDGSLFVAYTVPVPVAGSNTTRPGLRLTKFSSCANGFKQPAAPSVYPLTVADYDPPPALAGLPRQPGANHAVAAAADDSKLVYVSYLLPSSAGGDNVHVRLWSDSSSSWTADHIANTDLNGRRYFPTVCATGTNAFVAWYDRRAGDDKTSYYRRSILNKGAALGHEFNFSGSGHEDPQCLSGFPNGSVGVPDAELLCTDLPTLASLNTGTCQTGDCNTSPFCSLSKCDFRPQAVGGACTVANETCKVPPNNTGVARGAAIYGDYNQAACARGRMFVAWGSTTAPKDSCTMSGDACTNNSQCCSTACESGICHSKAGTTCSANGGACTTNADCCNDGGSDAGSCQGGVCFRRVGVFTASGGKATFIHIVGSSTATLFDSSGVGTPFTKSFDHTVTLGLDGRGGGFWDTLDSPAGGSAGAGFRLQPNDDDVLITSESESFGPAQTSFAFNTIVIHPGQTYVFTGGLSTAFPPQYAPYGGGNFSYSFNLTTSQEP